MRSVDNASKPTLGLYFFLNFGVIYFDLIDSFENVSKDIYFYGVTSTRGPEITVVKC